MLKQHTQLYRASGIRSISGLLKPPVFSLQEMEWSQDAVIHYLPGDKDTDLPDKHPYFHTIEALTVRHQLEYLVENPLGCTRQTVTLKEDIRQYHLKHPDFRMVQTDMAGVSKASVPFMINYGFLDRLYTYRKSPMAAYWQWKNELQTALKKGVELVAAANRQQYYILSVPDYVPGNNNMQRWVTKKDNQFYTALAGHDILTIFEVYRYLSSGHSGGGLLEDIPKEMHGYFNFIIHYNEKACLLNLGVLDYLSSNEDDAELLEAEVSMLGVTGSQHYTSKVAAKVFLASMTLLRTAELEVDKEKTTDEVVELDEADIDAIVNAESVSGYDEEDNIEEQSDVHAAVTPVHEQLADLFSNDETEPHVLSEPTLEERNTQLVDSAIAFGTLSVAEGRKILRELADIDALTNPYGDGTIGSATQTDSSKVTLDRKGSELPDSPTVFDKTMNASSLQVLDSQYIQHFMKPHILSAVRAFARKGVVVKGYEIVPTENLVGSYEDHILTLKPIGGQASTIRFRIPIVNEKGEFPSNGVKYRFRRQNLDKPIRKIAPNNVALSTDYGKLFITRAESVARSQAAWWYNQLMLKSIELDEQQRPIVRVTPTAVADSYFKSGKVFSSIASNVSYVYTKDLTFQFDCRTRYAGKDKPTLGPKERLVGAETDDITLCGFQNKTGKPIVMDKHGGVSVVDDTGLYRLGELSALLQLNKTTPPMEAAELSLLGKKIPLLVVLGYYHGMTNLLKGLGVSPTVIPPGKRAVVQQDEFAVKLKDVTLIFKRREDKVGLILNAFDLLKKKLPNIRYTELNTPLGYVNLLTDLGLTPRYLMELDNLDTLFVDPIAEENLRLMGEPTSFRGLLMRSCEMLENDQHPHPVDDNAMRKRGYDRIPGAIWKHYVKSLREFSGKRNTGKQRIEMNPWDVWRYITSDSALKIPEEINPIQMLKEVESLTFSGNGGRSKEGMSEETRIYHENAMGVVGEGGVDSGDVGVNTFTSANPNIIDVYGNTKPIDDSVDNVSARLSTSALVSPEVVFDDLLIGSAY